MYKRCRLNGKKLEDCVGLETKKASGAKCTDTQLDKLAKKPQFQSELDADLATLDLFLQHHVEPVAAVVSDEKETALPIPEAIQVETKYEVVPLPVPEVVKEDHQKFDLDEVCLLLSNLVKV